MVVINPSQWPICTSWNLYDNFFFLVFLIFFLLLNVKIRLIVYFCRLSVFDKRSAGLFCLMRFENRIIHNKTVSSLIGKQQLYSALAHQLKCAHSIAFNLTMQIMSFFFNRFEWKFPFYIFLEKRKRFFSLLRTIQLIYNTKSAKRFADTQ